MSMLELGIWSFPVLLALIFLRAPIGLAMMLCGIGGLWLALGKIGRASCRERVCASV